MRVVEAFMALNAN